MAETIRYDLTSGAAQTVLQGFDGKPACGRFELALAAGAEAVFYVLQEGGADASGAARSADYTITLGEGARLQMVFVTLGGAVPMQTSLQIEMAGRHAECRLGGLYLAAEHQEVGFSVRLSHSVPECYSAQLFKGVLRDAAQTRFDGLIYVAPDAQKTEAYQANHNLLLSPEARAEARPQLEIYADDVKCSHGATVGRLNEDELFYMRSRGITAAEAARLQQMAFVGEVLEMVGDAALREQLSDRVLARL